MSLSFFIYGKVFEGFQAFIIVYNCAALHTHIFMCYIFPSFMWYHTCFVLFLSICQFLGGLNMIRRSDLDDSNLK